MKRLDKFNIVVFCSFLAILFCFNVFSTDKAFSENENRTLAQKPTFTLKKVLNNTFSLEYEEYITDQFIARDAWVGLKAGLEKGFGKLENNGVYFGSSDALIERFVTYDEARFTRNLDLVKAFFDTQTIPTRLMLIPSATQVSEGKPSVSYDVDQKVLFTQAQALFGSEFVNLLPTFEQGKDDFYFKTDHHFNMFGAKAAYETLQGTRIEGPLQKVSEGFKGTIYSKSGMYWNKLDDLYAWDGVQNVDVTFPGESETVYDSVYFPENLTKKDQYLYYLNGNHSLVKISTNQPEKP
ncbi:MAG: hypothetical protein ACRDBX_03870, partial [Erysipelotrichaceae bacterium]